MADDIHPDMTLRDWLAFNATEQDITNANEVVKVLPGILAPSRRFFKYTREEARYRYADAMLAARKGGSGDG